MTGMWKKSCARKIRGMRAGKLDTVKMHGKSEKYDQKFMIGSIKFGKHGLA
jgi:hypothetical protein